ncbi:hypothetical protein H0H93_010862 [Arthromyces matolae]|nr:hypothetical protein H0H93_010862 [Arthromyces matolae]
MSSPQGAFINKLLLELENPPYGMYSVFHDFSIWKNGYEHPETEKLAFIFNILLDSSKNGYRLKEGVFEADRKTYGNAKIPELKSSDTDRSWIFHSLRQAGKEAGDELLARYDAELMASNRGELACDKLLSSPYTTTIDRAHSDFDDRGDPWNHEYGRRAHADLKRIRDHVELAFSEYRNANCNLVHEAQSPAPPKTPGKRKKAQSQKSNPYARAQELYDQPIEGILYFRKIDIDQLKGSYAYHRNPKFAFAIASQDLYLIKALASSERIAPTVYSFGQAMTIPSTIFWARLDYIRFLGLASAAFLLYNYKSLPYFPGGADADEACKMETFQGWTLTRCVACFKNLSRYEDEELKMQALEGHQAQAHFLAGMKTAEINFKGVDSEASQNP